MIPDWRQNVLLAPRRASSWFSNHDLRQAVVMFLASRAMWRWVTIAVVLSGAYYFGRHPSALWLLAIVLTGGALVFVSYPILGLFALISVALLVRTQIQTGTEVTLTAAAALSPLLVGAWILDMLRRGELCLAPSRANLPLALFLLSGLLSLVVGNALWDPAVPRSEHFYLVQTAQWSIFATSAGVFWLSAATVRDERWLRRLMWAWLLIAGGLAILRIVPGGDLIVDALVTAAFVRAPFWLLTFSVTAGQLLFNDGLSKSQRTFLVAVLVATLTYVFILFRENTSYWVGVTAAAGVLAWLRWPHLRWPIIVVVILLTLAGLLVPALWEFAGGDAEWSTSGGSRLLLISRVVEVTMRNPITGLGPAAYRPYTMSTPLPYGRAYWMRPLISSHNNYIDLFSQTGLIGLGLFLWFMAELGRLGWKLRRRYPVGFAGGYVNAMLAAWVGMMVIMAMADWFLPFVYNIGFGGYQASILVWMFLGGLVALDRMR